MKTIRAIPFAIILLSLCLSVSCSSQNQQRKQDDSRYWQAIREDQALQKERAEQEKRAGQSTTNAATPQRKITMSKAHRDQLMLNGPASLLQKFTLRPIRENGQLVAYAIDDLDRQAMRGIDIQKDDQIIAIDGQLPQNPDAYFEQWKRVSVADSSTVTLRRNNQNFDLNFIFTNDEPPTQNP